MNPAIGPLSLGVVPRVVGTVADCATMSSSGVGLVNLCDMVEIRLDKLGVKTPNWVRTCLTWEAAGLPVIVTLRLQAEGGKWVGSDKARKGVLESAIDTLSTIDIELNSSLCDPLCEYAEQRGKGIIVSHHDFIGTPSLAELRAVVARIRRHKNAIPKIATMVNLDADIRTLRNLLDAEIGQPICILGMGAAGVRTRTLLPALGSCLTYGYVDKPSASGQLPSVMLVDYLRTSISEYNQDFVIRKEIMEFV